MQRTSLCLLWAKSGHWTNLVRRLFGSAYEVLTGLGPYLKQKGSGENRSPIARRFLCSRRLAAERASLAWFLCLARRAKGPRIGTVPPRYSRPVHQTGFARMRWGAGHASSCGCLCCGKARTQRKSSNCCQWDTQAAHCTSSYGSRTVNHPPDNQRRTSVAVPCFQSVRKPRLKIQNKKTASKTIFQRIWRNRTDRIVNLAHLPSVRPGDVRFGSKADMCSAQARESERCPDLQAEGSVLAVQLLTPAVQLESFSCRWAMLLGC